MVLPWQPEVVWVAADLQMDGQEVAQAPRVALPRQREAAAAMGSVADHRDAQENWATTSWL